MGVTGMNFLVQQMNSENELYPEGKVNDIRIVTLLESDTGLSPSEITELANSDPLGPKYKTLLGLIFKYGQNDFQNSPTHRSVGASDVIHIPFQDGTGIGYRLHEVLPNGFATLIEVKLVSAIDLRQRSSQAS